MDTGCVFQEGKWICTFPPRLDTAACERIESEIRRITGGGAEAVIFNLAGVEYVSSSFMRICLMAAKQAGADRFSCIHVSPFVKKIFKIAGFDRMMRID